MNNEICANCGKEKRAGYCADVGWYCVNQAGDIRHPFKPSGRVAVPVAFVEAVRDEMEQALGEWIAVAIEYVPLPLHGWKKLQAMLDQIDGKE